MRTEQRSTSVNHIGLYYIPNGSTLHVPMPLSYHAIEVKRHAYHKYIGKDLAEGHGQDDGVFGGGIGWRWLRLRFTYGPGNGGEGLLMRVQLAATTNVLCAWTTVKFRFIGRQGAVKIGYGGNPFGQMVSRPRRRSVMVVRWKGKHTDIPGYRTVYNNAVQEDGQEKLFCVCLFVFFFVSSDTKQTITIQILLYYKLQVN